MWHHYYIDPQATWTYFTMMTMTQRNCNMSYSGVPHLELHSYGMMM
jgi:hypothetical protein